MGNSESSAVRVSTRIWKVPFRPGSTIKSDDRQEAFRRGMHREGCSWVMLRHENGKECRLYVDGTLVRTFPEDASGHSTMSGPFPLPDGSTGNLTILKNTRWVDTTWNYRYNLLVNGQPEPNEINSRTLSAADEAPLFFKASINGHTRLNSKNGKDCIGYEIKVVVEDESKPRIVVRRYRDFILLSNCLKWAWHDHLQFALGTLPKVPLSRKKDRLGEKYNARLIEDRTRALDAYIHQVLRLPRVVENPDVLAFLDLVPELNDIKFGEMSSSAAQASSGGTILPNDDFEAILLDRTKGDLSSVITGPSRVAQDCISTLATELPLKKVFTGLLEVKHVEALLEGFERVRRNKSIIDQADFNAWTEAHLPSLLDVLKDRIRRMCDRNDAKIRFPPKLESSSTILSDHCMKYLTAAFNECYGCTKWARLYANHVDGLSFQTLCTAIEGYDGPTLIVIQDTQGCKFGALSTTRWKEEVGFYSGLSGALFSLEPVFFTYRRTSAGGMMSSKPNKNLNNVQYLNSRSKTLPLGMGFGGELHSRNSGPMAPHPRLWIDADFDTNFATIGTNDFVYEAGPILGNDVTRDTFQIAFIEVWGLGGDDALQARAEWRRQKDRVIQKQRQIDKAQFANNGFDREYLLGETFGGNRREGNQN